MGGKGTMRAIHSYRRLFAKQWMVSASLIVMVMALGAVTVSSAKGDTLPEAEADRPRSPIGLALGGLDYVLTEARSSVLSASNAALTAVAGGTMQALGMGLGLIRPDPTDAAVTAAGLRVVRAATGAASVGAVSDPEAATSELTRHQIRRRHGAVLASSGSDSTHHETLGYLMEEAGFEVDTVVEGLNPLPFYCVAFEQTEYKTKEERLHALEEVKSYFALRRQQAPWYDFWTGWEEWAITEIAQADTELSRLAALMDLRLEGVDVHMLPLPSTEIDFHSGHDASMADYEPQSKPAKLVNDYGYHIVFIEEGLGLEGPETKILMRKTELMTPEESRKVRAEINAWLSDHPDGWSFNYLWDRMFFRLLIGVEEEAIALGTMQDLMLHDIIIKLSLLPNVTTRMRHEGKPIEHYPPPPCA